MDFINYFVGFFGSRSGPESIQILNIMDQQSAFKDKKVKDIIRN